MEERLSVPTQNVEIYCYPFSIETGLREFILETLDWKHSRGYQCAYRPLYAPLDSARAVAHRVGIYPTYGKLFDLGPGAAKNWGVVRPV